MIRALFLCFMLFPCLGQTQDVYPNKLKNWDFSKEKTNSSTCLGIVAVIGGGPAGLSAASMLQELGFQTVLFDQKAAPIPQDNPTTFWLGGSSPKWNALLKSMRDSFTHGGGTIIAEEAVGISSDRSGFLVSTAKDSFAVKAVIVATGALPIGSSFMNKKGERVFTNCWEAKTFSPKDTVIVVGQGKPLFFAALKAASSANRVFVFPYRTNTINLEPLRTAFPSLSITHSQAITDIGSTKDKAFMSYSQGTAKLQKEASYLIVAEDKEPSSDLVKRLCSIDSSQAIVTSNETGETSLSGLFACGEVAGKKALTAVQASAEGQKVGIGAATYLVERGIAPKKQAPLPQQPAQSPAEATGPA